MPASGTTTEQQTPAEYETFTDRTGRARTPALHAREQRLRRRARRIGLVVTVENDRMGTRGYNVKVAPAFQSLKADLYCPFIAGAENIVAGNSPMSVQAAARAGVELVFRMLVKAEAGS